jgi:choline/glycine/proline betaine transport protein
MGRSPLLLLGAAAVVMVIGIVVSPAGSRRIDGKTEGRLGNFAWFSLMFCGGTLSGLLIWATAEPLYHLLGNPLLAKGQAETAAATAPALRLTLFHWALHPWALFALVGVALAWGASHYRLPLRPSSALAPIFNGKPPPWLALPVDGAIGALVLWSLTVLLGLGASQAETAYLVLSGHDPATTGLAAAEAKARIAARAQGLTGEDLTAFLRTALAAPNSLLAVLGVIGGFAALLAFTGFRRGAGLLATLTVLATGLFLAVVFIAGPGLYIVDTWINSLGDYLGNLVNLSLMTRPNQTGDAWQGWWTLFYIATWMGMAPLVGLLMASISRGRSVRAMLFAGFVAPAAATTLVVGVLGGAALHIELFGDDGLIEPLKQNPTLALYEMLKTFAPAENANGGLALLPAAAALIQLAALLAGAAAGMVVLRNLFAQGGRRFDLLAPLAMLLVVAAAILLWRTLGPAGWQSMRVVLFLAGLPAALFAISAVVAFLRPARTPAGETVEAD